MSTSRHIGVVCGIITLLTLVITLLFVNGEKFGIVRADTVLPYTQKLFTTDKVHTIDIVANKDDWQNMLDNARSEEYITCDVVIDGEAYHNVAIRPKGNSSLRQVSSSDSDRYSFKVEFDHYDKNTTYYGLDKLALNNLIQDKTCMKDYICLDMLRQAGAYAPLASYVWVTLNGEDWGLYLAVEGIEDGFAQRNFGSDYGSIYKPESMNMGGGNGKNNFEDFAKQWKNRKNGEGFNHQQTAEIKKSESIAPESQSELPIMNDKPENQSETENKTADNQNADRRMPNWSGFGKGMGGNTAVRLQYSDDNIESYSNIFDNAVFDVSKADKERLIASLKQLGEQKDLEQVLEIDEVMRYFAAHTFVLNNDSYTGMIVHNYYVHEHEGKLSMIGWDYNLAFGGMGGGDASALVNDAIDTPANNVENLPMLSWIFSNEEYTKKYHEIYLSWIESYFNSGQFEETFDNTYSLIAPYVKKDPTAFCTYEEFEKAAPVLKKLCLLRAESVKGQLDGSIPSTDEAQKADSSALINADEVDIAAMGNHMGGFGGRRGIKDNEEQGENPPEGFPQMQREWGENPPEGFPQMQREWGENPPEGFPREFKHHQMQTENANNSEEEVYQWCLLAGSLALLGAGLFAAAKFKRR